MLNSERRQPTFFWVGCIFFLPSPMPEQSQFLTPLQLLSSASVSYLATVLGVHDAHCGSNVCFFERHNAKYFLRAHLYCTFSLVTSSLWILHTPHFFLSYVCILLYGYPHLYVHKQRSEVNPWWLPLSTRALETWLLSESGVHHFSRTTDQGAHRIPPSLPVQYKCVSPCPAFM